MAVRNIVDVGMCSKKYPSFGQVKILLKLAIHFYWSSGQLPEHRQSGEGRDEHDQHPLQPSETRHGPHFKFGLSGH